MYHRYKEDFQLMKQLNIKHYRSEALGLLGSIKAGDTEPITQPTAGTPAPSHPQLLIRGGGERWWLWEANLLGWVEVAGWGALLRGGSCFLGTL